MSPNKRTLMTKCGSSNSSSTRSIREVSRERNASWSITRSKCSRQRHWIWWPSISLCSPKSNAKWTAFLIQTSFVSWRYPSAPSTEWRETHRRVMLEKAIWLTWSIWSFKATLVWRCSLASRQTEWEHSERPSKVGDWGAKLPRQSKDSRLQLRRRWHRNRLSQHSSYRHWRPSRRIWTMKWSNKGNFSRNMKP